MWGLKLTREGGPLFVANTERVCRRCGCGRWDDLVWPRLFLAGQSKLAVSVLVAGTADKP